MPPLGVWLIIALAFFAISMLFVIAMIQNSVDEDRLIATPSIRQEDAVFTSFASIKVRGSADEVFATVMRYEGYPHWSPFHHYGWNNKTMDCTPRVGSTGSFTLSMEDFPERVLPIKLTLLDREARRVAEVSTDFPKWLLCSERVQEVIAIEGQPGFCEYRTYQTTQGLGGYYLLLTHLEDFDDCQRKCATELKAYVEQGRRRGSVRAEELHEPTILEKISQVVTKKLR